MNKIYLFASLLLLVVTGRAQLNYNFTAVAGTYVPIIGGTNAALINAQPPYSTTDEGIANAIPLGFSFNYNSVVYSTISACTNGFAAFQTLTPITDPNTEDYYTSDLGFGPLKPNSRPVLAPLWDDLDLFSVTDLKYITTGAAPNRVFTLQWSNVFWDISAEDVNIEFQLKLYETTNIIEFHYRQLAGLIGSFTGAAIGITATGTGNGNFLALSNSSASPAVSSTNNTYSITAKPANGQVYRFTPIGTLPVLLADFTGQRQNDTNVLNWLTAQEHNNKGFALQRSQDGINFSTIAFIASKAAGGNSSTPIHYSFTDIKPLTSGNHYRLAQFDYDDRTTYSRIVLIKGVKPAGFRITGLYPNPVENELRMVVSTTDNISISLIISDIAGKTIMGKKVMAIAGENSISVNVAALHSGIYLIKATSKSGENKARFIKQ